MTTPALAAAPSVHFHRTEAGHLTARLDTYCMMAVPDRAGLAVLAAYGIDKPPEHWTRDDFYIVGKRVDTEADFIAHAIELAQHDIDRARLQRTPIAYHGHTPWGLSQSSMRYADGIVYHSTAGHGGFDLDEAARAKVHSGWGMTGRFFEEDVDWAIVAFTFPELFTAYERKSADEILRHWRPHGYEAVTGVTLAPGQSRVRDEEAFLRDHADRWIVISAITSTDRPGFVECVATLGRARDGRAERRFLVPANEYRPDPFGFVINEARHESYAGASSFVGWNR